MVLIAGPCQIESKDHALMMAGALKEITDRLGIGLVYKSSFDKANRSSISSKRGVGLDEGLAVLDAVAKTYGCPVLTDVHLPEHCAEAASVVDVLQIPAFLVAKPIYWWRRRNRQMVNVKKGQVTPWDMKHVAEKIAASGNDQILLTERGTR